MLLAHRGKQPHIHESTYIAPTATVCGDVSIGPDCQVLFGAVLTAEGGPVEIGANCIIMEGAVIRGSARHPARLGQNILVGPRAYLSGCVVEDNVFLATGATIFNGARIGAGSEVRVNGIAHLKTTLAPNSVVPVGWVAVGDPAQILPPDKHDAIWALQAPLNFPQEVFGLERAPADVIMPQLTRRYGRALSDHNDDREIG